MYKKIDQITETKNGFSADNKYLFAPKKEKGFIVYNCHSNIRNDYKTIFDVFDILPLENDKFVITDSYHRSGYIYFIENKGNIALMKDISNFVVTDKMNDYLNIQVIEKDEVLGTKWLPSLYNWKEDKVLWQKNCGIFFVSNYILARISPTDIARLDLLTGEVLWEYSFAHYPKTKNIHKIEESVTVHSHPSSWIGVYENELWLGLNNYQLLILDIHTGKQIDLLGEPVERGNTIKKYVIGGLMDAESKKLINVGNLEYREIDMLTRQVTYIDLNEEFNNYGVSSCECSFDQDYIYFFDKIFFGNQPRNKVAVLDRKTMKVVWVHDFAQYGTFPMQMEKTDTHLFVLDNGGTLHIFGKEAK